MNGYVNPLRKYLAIMDVEYKYIFKYRTELLTNLIRTLISPLAIIIVWGLVYAASGTTSINGFTGSSFFAYFIIASAVATVSVDAGLAYDMQADIKGGGVVVNLVKPVSWPLFHFFDEMAESLLDALTVLVPTMLLLFIVFGVNISLYNLGMFALELALIFVLTSVIFFIVGCLSAVFVNIGGMVNLILWTFNVLGGRLIPLNLFPSSISAVLQNSPFYLVYYLPSATFAGIVSQSFIVQGIINLVMWSAGFFILAAIAWKLSRKAIMASGG